jgi:hypothetical protein
MGQAKAKFTLMATVFLAISTLGSGCIIETSSGFDTFACNSDMDCFADEVCDFDGTCVSDCNIAGCAFSEDLCETSTGMCFTPECSSSSECYVGEFCGLDGVCYEYAQTCLGSADCVGDGICTTVNVCDMNYECNFDSECPWMGTLCNEFGFCEYDDSL